MFKQTERLQFAWCTHGACRVKASGCRRNSDLECRRPEDSEIRLFRRLSDFDSGCHQFIEKLKFRPLGRPPELVCE